MKVIDFIENFHNHPVFFIGSGFSLRYLENSFSWSGLLQAICEKIYGNDEHYLELKVQHQHKNLDKIASILEGELTEYLSKDRNHTELKHINDEFFKLAKNEKNVSRFKILIAEMLGDLSKRKNSKLENELSLLKKARKNISSIITTNYDLLIEDIFGFNPLVGNNILLSNPYGSVYKIHGCITSPESLIITDNDYKEFNKRYELIRAQLLSLFIHNPIIFIGYSISDDNIKSLLKTIFSYVKPNSEEAKKIRGNFLLIEYEENSESDDVCEHDIELEGYETIRINKIRTDNYTPIYQAISELQLPVSAMDIRKVQNIMAEIVSGSKIKVSITEDIDLLKNDDKVLAIGSEKTITYEYQNFSQMMVNYFSIIDEENKSLIQLLNKQSIRKGDFFPIYGFSKICPDLIRLSQYKNMQRNKLKETISRKQKRHKTTNKSISDIFSDNNIPKSSKEAAIFYEVYRKNISLEECKEYLISYNDKNHTNYRRLLCLYDYMVNDNTPLTQ